MSDGQQAAEPGPQRHQSWRPGKSRKAVRSARRLKIAAGSIFLASLVVLLIWLFFRPSPLTPVTFIGIGRTDYGPGGIALNPGAKQDVDALAEVFDTIHQLDPNEVTERVDTSEALHDGLVDYLKGACDKAQTLLIFCSLHGHVASNGQGEVELMLQVAGSTTAPSARSITYRSLTDMLAQCPAQRVALLLDVQSPADWVQGTLAPADITEQLAAQSSDLAKKITIICATSEAETSWAAVPGSADDNEAAWKHTPGTVFGEAVRDAFCDGSADANGNAVLELGELYDFVKGRCSKWNQSVQWFGRESGRDTKLTVTFPTPPEVKEKASAEKAEEKGNGEAAPAPEERLAALWKSRDELWLANPTDLSANPQRLGIVSSTRPLSWRQFNHQLVRLEHAIRYRLHELPEHRVEIGRRLTEAESQLASLASEADPSAATLPSVLWGAEPPPTPEQAAALSGILQALGADPAPPEQAELLKEADQRRQFAAWLVTQIADADVVQLPSRLSQAGKALETLSTVSGAHWRPETWPVELRILQELTAAFQDRQLDATTAQTISRSLAARIEANRGGGLLRDDYLREEVWSQVEDLLRQNQRAVLAAERWLAAEQIDRANEWLDRAEGAMRDARQRADGIRQLVEIRETLLAELPDHAYWVACHLEFDGTKFDPSIRQSESPAAASLRELFEDLNRVDQALGSGSALSPRAIKELSDGASSHLLSLDQALAAECARSLDPARWPEIDYTLRNPWIRAETRQRMMTAFQDRKSGQATAGSASGAWHAFWCAKTLSLVFDELDPTATGKDPAARTRRGSELAARWSDVRETLERPEESGSSRFERCARLAPASNRADDIEQDLVRKRASVRRTVRTMIAAAWARRGREIVEYLMRVPDSVIEKSALTEDARLAAIPDLMRCNSARTAELPVSWTRAATGQTFNLILLGDDVKWGDASGSVRSVSSGQSVPLQLEVRSPRTVRIALTRRPDNASDRDDEPLDIRRITLAPEFNAQGWSVAFVLPESNGKQELYQRALRANRRVAASEVWLNAGSAVGTQVRLRRPPDSPAHEFQVQLLCVNKEGAQRPSGLSGKVSFAEGQEEAPLTLAAGEGAAAQIDASGGMLFRVDAGEDQQFDLEVEPWIRGARFFLEGDPLCTLRDGRVQVRVRRKVDPGVLPEEIEFTVEPGQKLRQLSTPSTAQTRKLTSNFAETTVEFQVEEADVDKLRGMEVSLSVAGVPHAYRWRLGAPGPQPLMKEPLPGGQDRDATVRIAAPDASVWVATDKDLRSARLQVFAPHDAYRSIAPGRLQLLMRPKDRPPVLLEEWPDVRGPSRTTTVRLAEGLLVLEAAMTERTYPAEDLAAKMSASGEYDLLARLIRGDETIEQVVGVGIDRTAPEVDWKSVPPAEKGDWKLTNTDKGRRMLCVASVVEPDSPVTRYTLIILKGDSEVLKSDLGQPSTKDEMEIKIGRGALPSEDGTYEFVLEVENAAGLVSRNKSRRTVTIRAPQPATPSKSGQ